MNWKLEIRNWKFYRGQSLIELLVGIGVIAVISTSVVGLIYASLKSAKVSRERSLAQSLINDMASSVESLINDDWHSLWSASGGIVYLSLDEGADSANNNSLALDEIFGFNAAINLGSSGNTSLASAWQTSDNCQAGQCLSFDNVDDYLQVSDTTATSSPIDLTTAMTFSVWVYPTDLAAYDPILAKVSTSTVTGYELANSSGSLRLILKTPSTTCDYSAGTLAQNVWQHVVAAYDGSNINLYLNGQPVGSPSACSTGAAVNDENLLIGGRATDSAKFSGRIDEVRIYNRALDSQEISGLYSGINKFYPFNSAGIWQLKHGKETTAVANIEFTRSFYLERVLRDSSNNIVASGGDNDPGTKKVIYTVSWGNGFLASQEEYITRTNLNNVFYQTDWSGGSGSQEAVFFSPTEFDTASSAIIFSGGSLELNLASSTSGDLSSVVFDSQQEKGVILLSLLWQGTLGSGNSVKFQLASADSSSGPWTFVGYDNTSSSYYPSSGSAQSNTAVPIISKNHFNHRYLRYKIFLTGTSTSPLIQDISILWNR
ncbi:MAG: LamG domain-containing protein [Patescibacteria group bacterium]